MQRITAALLSAVLAAAVPPVAQGADVGGNGVMRTAASRRSATVQERRSYSRRTLDAAWENIRDQIRTYLILDQLTGAERQRAAMKIVTGYPQLKRDVDFFCANASPRDPRLPAVLKLKAVMEQASSRRSAP